MSKVFVYRNLRKKCWSIRDVKTGLVIAHKDTVILSWAEFKVSEAGRQRVLREQRKNVHAGIQGVLSEVDNTLGLRVSYNPYKGPNFVNQLGFPINRASVVKLDEFGKVWV